MKKFASLLLALVMVLSLVACGNKPADDGAADDGAEEIVIGVSLMDYQWEYFQDMAAAMRKVAAENGVTLIEADGGSDVAKQMKDIEDMIAAGKVKALVINAVSSAGIVPVIEEANAAGIPVITVDVQAEGGDVYAHVASDNKAIGATAAQDAVAYLESVYGEAKGTVACVGYPQISTMKDRAEGFCAEMAKYPNIKVIDQSVVELTFLCTLCLHVFGFLDCRFRKFFFHKGIFRNDGRFHNNVLLFFFLRFFLKQEIFILCHIAHL